MPRKQIWSGVALAAAVTAALSGCTLKASDGTPQSFAELSALSPQDAVKAAGRAVAAHPSAKVHAVLSAPNATEASDVTASFGEHPALQGTLAVGPAGSAPDPSSAIPIAYADHIMFMKMGTDPSMAAQMEGKAWLRMDLAAMAGDPRTAGIGSDVLENTSPTKGLTMLTASKDLHKVGEEQHGGVQTVHYAGTVSGADALDPNLIGRGLTQESADAVTEAMAGGAVTSMAYDVWLRADGLPVAQAFTETTPVGALKGAIDFTDWGTGVKVDKVPDSQSVDYMEMVAKAAAASASPDASGSASPSQAPSASAAPSPSDAPSASSSSSEPAAPATPATPATPSKPSPTGTASAPATPATPSTPRSTGSSSSSSA
ncbi:hypothetical protein GCM10009839_55700 [Catenulispora yoronensis]|uniref:Lipoprotein n=1 Tax=Catenulispora yoronensis TaxID=450799 RepID=A0ABP5GFD4_9ACTN